MADNNNKVNNTGKIRASFLDDLILVLIKVNSNSIPI